MYNEDQSILVVSKTTSKNTEVRKGVDALHFTLRLQPSVRSYAYLATHSGWWSSRNSDSVFSHSDQMGNIIRQRINSPT